MRSTIYRVLLSWPLIFCAFACKNVQLIDSTWEQANELNVCMALLENGSLNKSELKRFLTYPNTEKEFEGKSYRQIIGIINSKAEKIPEKLKLCLDDTVCLELLKDWDTDNNEIIISFTYENLSNTKIEVDSAFFTFRLSSFDPPEEFGFISFKNRMLGPKEKVLNKVRVDKALFENNLDYKFELQDYRFSIDRFSFNIMD